MAKQVSKTKAKPAEKPAGKANSAPSAKPKADAKTKAGASKAAPAAPKKADTKPVVVKKTAAVAKADKPVSVRAAGRPKADSVAEKPVAKKPVAKETFPKEPVFPEKNPHSKVFIGLSKQRLLSLKDELVDSMSGMASETLRSRAQDSEASAFGMHQADAGSDAYDRDFTLSLLSQEQDALYEIEEALKRIEKGTYGICEMSAKTIPTERLEVRPYARFTVECQEIVDRELGPNSLRRGIRSLFGLGTDEDDEDGDEDSVEDDKN